MSGLLFIVCPITTTKEIFRNNKYKKYKMPLGGVVWRIIKHSTIRRREGRVNMLFCNLLVILAPKATFF